MVQGLKNEMTLKGQRYTVVVAGCSSGAGKTCVAETVIGILSSYCLTGAGKITVTHGERGCPHGGKGCNVCSSLGGDFQIITKDSVILQEGTDTCRLSSAGGRPVVWVITKDTALESAWREMNLLMSNVDCTVIESNSLAVLIEPTLTLMVVDPSVSRKIWKPSAERLIATADYVVLNNRGPLSKREVVLSEIKGLRGKRSDPIIVDHPDDLTSQLDFLQNLKSILDLA